MTREEAVKIITVILDCCKGKEPEGYGEREIVPLEKSFKALGMAIEVLEQERPEIIRCKNCRHDNNCEIQYSAQAGSKFFCGSAERKEE